MWKYVRCRIRETCDRAYSILDVGKNWSCGVQQTAAVTSDASDQGPHKSKSEVNKCDISWFLACHRTKHYSSKNNGRKRIHEKEHESTIQHDLLGAITWSGAIICGWYASQLLCLHRRQYCRDFKRNYNILTVSSRALHNNVKSSCIAFASPDRPPPLSEITLKEKFTFDHPANTSHIDYKACAVEISNENEESNSKTSKKQSVQDAVGDLVTFLGDVEYKMGVQSIASGHFREAVTHLKLATNHNHIGATFNLGLCYEKGLGVPKNLRRAMECYQIASAKGHPKAIYNLGVFYAQGLGGLEQDYNAAKQCFITAANLGQKEARIALELDSAKHNIGKDPALSKIGDKNLQNCTILAA